MTILRRHRQTIRAGRPRLALTVPAIAAALLLSACSGASSVDQTSQAGGGGDTTTSESATGEQTTGGETTGGEPAELTTLTVDNAFALTTMDPSRSRTPTSAVFISGVYQTLLKQDPEDLSFSPQLAESFTASEDAKTYTFTLRDDVTFSDGGTLTSADVVFTFNRLAALKQGGSFLMNGLTVTAPDEKTVVITSETPRPAIPAMMATPTFVVFSEAMVTGAGGTAAEDAPEKDQAETWFNTHSAGSGPYMLESYATDDQIILVRDENYWGDDLPEFDRVVIRNMPAATQLLNVQRGENEIALDLSAAQSASLAGEPAVTVLTSPSSAVFRVQMQMDPGASEITSNTHLQNAVRYGLNYDAIVQLAGEGAVRAAGVVPSTIAGSLPAEEAPTTDIERAKQEVAASGIADPSVTLTYATDMTVNGLDFGTIAQRVKSDLEAIGIQVNLEGMPITPFLTEWVKEKTEMTVIVNMPDYLDPAYYASFAPGDGADAGRAGWKTTEDQALFDLGLDISSTVDDAERADLMQQLLRRFNEESPYIPLLQTAQTVVSSANLTGVALHPTWTLDVTRVGTE